jgi:hypothetical protein
LGAGKIRDRVPVEEGPSEWIHDERKKKRRSKR